MSKAIEHGINGYTDEEWEVYRKAKTTKEYFAVDRMRDERRRREEEEELKERWPSTEAARLFTQLGETFTACQKLLEQNPAIEAAAKLADGERHDVFTMLRDNLEKANRAPRCEYQKRRAPLSCAEGARAEVLQHAPGDGGGASDEVQPAGAGRCELNPGGA